MTTANSTSQKIEAIERSRDRGIGAEVSLNEIVSNLQLAERVELFPASRVVMIDVRFGELRHDCDESEWKKLKQHLESSGIRTRRAKWWEFHLR